LAIHASAELSRAIRKSNRAAAHLLKAAKSRNQGSRRNAIKSWLSAQQQRRDIWRAMATPLAPSNEPGSRQGRVSAKSNPASAAGWPRYRSSRWARWTATGAFNRSSWIGDFDGAWNQERTQPSPGQGGAVT